MIIQRTTRRSAAAAKDKLKDLTVLDGERVRIASSTLPNAGKGLFATHQIEAGEFITLYGGRKCTAEQAGRSVYVYGPDENGNFWDAAKESKQNALGRYANDAVGPSGTKEDKKRINAIIKFLPEHNAIGLCALHQIEEGDEVFVEYGAGYWKQKIITYLSKPIE